MLMNNIPRQQLYQLIATYGPSLCDDPRRCEALLKDLCAQYRPEVSVLVGALKEKVAAELLASQNNIPQTVLLARLTKRIHENLALTEDAARWAVESWALALGVIPNTGRSEPNPEPPKEKETPPKRKQHRLLIGASITTIAIGALGVYALYRQPNTSSLEQIKIAQAEGNYQKCVVLATAIPQNSRIYTEAQTLLQQCQLSLAKQLTADSDFAAAISEAAKIPRNSVGYQEAQQRISEWSGSILETATNNYQTGNLNNAIAIAKTIPESSSVYPKAQGTIQQWNKEWQQNQSYWQAAQKALNEGKWQSAISEAKKVKDNPYWRKKIEPIIQKAESQIAAPKLTGVRQPQPQIKQPALPAPQNPPRKSIPAPVRYPPKRVQNQSRPQPRQSQLRPPVRYPPKRVQNQPRPRPPGITPAPIDLSREGQDILCKKFPLNSRCVGKHR